jgi:hypothetical protein
MGVCKYCDRPLRQGGMCGLTATTGSNPYKCLHSPTKKHVVV